MLAIMVRYLIVQYKFLKILEILHIIYRYNWKQFAVVTSDIAGHDDFIQAVREEVLHMKEDLNFK